MLDIILAVVWIVLLVSYIVASLKDTKSNNAVKKEITRMNDLLLEQNARIREQNQHLNTLIMRVCSKSVRERKNQEKPSEETT